jgi:dihydroxy-acid dehydratase
LGEKPERRRTEPAPPVTESQTLWQAIYRRTVRQLSDGAVIEDAVACRGVARTVPRQNH